MIRAKYYLLWSLTLYVQLLFSSAEHSASEHKPHRRGTWQTPPVGEHPQHPLVLTPRALLHTLSFFFLFHILGAIAYFFVFFSISYTRCNCILFRFFLFHILGPIAYFFVFFLFHILDPIAYFFVFFCFIY